MNYVYEYSQFVEDDPNIVLQEIVTYKKTETGLKKITVSRRFYANNDYQDSCSEEVL